MKVSIIGTGYVGLVTGACLAEKGHQVICVDIDREKIDKINQGIPPFFEKDLEELIKKNIRKNLFATPNLEEAILSTEITLIAVGTPFNGREIDLSYVVEVSRQIGSILKNKSDYHLVVVKSTVVPGTTDTVVLPLLEKMSGKKAGVDFGVGMNPEFLTEGEAVSDFMIPDRIVLGGIDNKSTSKLGELYRSFEGVEIVRTNNKTAELIKYTSNALLATMISFSNEIGNLCSALGGVDVTDVLRGVHLSKYLSTVSPGGEHLLAPIASFLWAGCGFGGSCLPKDVKALIVHGEKAGQPMPLLNAVIKINQEQPLRVINLLSQHFPTLAGLKVSVLGLSFKPDTNDMRESPAITLINNLLEEGAYIKAYDPVALEEAGRILGNKIEYCNSLHQSIQDAEAVILVTSWDEFKVVPELLGKFEQPPLFIDGRRFLHKDSVPRYQGVGL